MTLTFPFRFLIGFSLLVVLASPASAAVEIGQPVGKLTALDAEDEPLLLIGNTDRPATALIFLSSRSETAAKSMEFINLLYRKHRRLGVLYIGICSNDVETADELGEFTRKRGGIFTIYRDPEGKVAKQLGVAAVPSVALIDGSGKLVHRGDLASEGGVLAFDAAVVSKTTPRSDEGLSLVPTPIDQPGEKREVDDQYGALAFSSELVFERIPGAAVYHCSTITEAPNGDLLCLWYGGTFESADDQSLFLSRRKPGERVWSKPQVLLRGPNPLPGNAVIFVDGHEQVWIVWCRMESVRPIGRGQGWDNCRLMYRVSSDNGMTWSKDSEFLGAELRAVPRNPPICRADGALVLPMEGIVNGVHGSVFLIGPDGGATWRQGGFTPGGSQPGVVERKDGTLFSLMRKAPRLTQIESSDGGETWTDAVDSTLRNPDAGISLVKLANGHQIVVFNDSDLSRTPLSVARSIDEGKTWETPLHLESNPGEYSYPCVIQTRDGKIHVSYTYRRYSIKHVEFNEDWLIQMERPN